MSLTEAEAESLVSAIKNEIVHKVELAFKNEIYFKHTKYKSVLNCAAYYGKVSIVSLLLKNEKLIKKTDLDSSLYIAAEKGHTTVVELLLKHGANIEFEDLMGVTPLLIAVRSNHKDTVNILIEAGANINAQDEFNHWSLQVACENGFLSIVKLLIDAGADINMQEETSEMTALFYATHCYNNQDVLKLLLDRGADVTITDYSGNTVLHYCIEQHYSSLSKLLIQVLLKNGADVSRRNEDGYDVFDLAYVNGYYFSTDLITLVLYLNINTPKPERHYNDDISKIWDSCKSELELMETCKISESNISYRQLLLESNNSKLAAYLSNSDIVSELDTLVYIQ